MEQIVVVDENDNFIGEEEKEKCHDGTGILHRAFLAMVFNSSGELLLARRSRAKRLWPGYWDGTVASHLFRGEDYEQASRRRLQQEIGLITDDVSYLFKFQYSARYKDIGSENEICAVTVVNGVEGGRLFPNTDEISEIRYIAMDELIDGLEKRRNHFTPWLRLAARQMKEQRMLRHPDRAVIRGE